jgi:dihydroorotase
MAQDKSKPASLLIKGGHVIDPAAKVNAPMDVLLRDGHVAEVAPPNKIRAGADEILEARGLVVAPGFIDLHVHLREPGQSYKETLASGTAAAAAGGFTSVCCMPNTSPIVDSPDWVNWLRQPQRGAVVNVFPIASATQASKGAVLTDFRGLQRAGAVAVSDDGRPILNETTMREALRLGAEINLPVIQHAEDTRLTENCSMNESATSFRLGLRGMKSLAEASIIDRDVQVAQQFTGTRYHVAHLSTADALKAVRRGKRSRARITCEVTPHHFTLTDADVHEYDTNYKMNPPLRSAEDREALLVALADGTVDAIATDHAPHAMHEKMVEFEKAAFGITGLETALALAITRLHRDHNVVLPRIVELFTSGPTRVVDLPGRGTLARGSYADVTIFDPKRRWTFDAAKSRSKSRNTPFDGWQLTGKVVATVVNGRVVYRAN